MALEQAGGGGGGCLSAYEVVRRTACFADLARGEFERVVRFVAGEQGQGAKLWLELAGEEEGDRLKGTLHPMGKGMMGLYSQNVGTITQEGQVKVKVAGGGVIGTIEEAFAQVLKVGDRFVLGGSCVRVEGSHGMRVDVTECAGQTPTVPRWFSGLMSMEAGLAGKMREFRGRVRAIAPAGEGAMARMLMRQYRVAEEVAAPAAAYLHAQHRYADIPVEGELLVERVPDEGKKDKGIELATACWCVSYDDRSGGESC